jgi:hypothetical protein
MGQSAGAVARFDQGYLDQHPEVAQQLARRPRLVDNPQYLANHPGLDAYLAAHPIVRTELQTHPNRFMSDEWRDDVYGPGWRNRGSITSGAVERFDRGYLDEHPEIAREFGRNPRLVDDPRYLANHPGLDAYLAAHPQVRTELQAHPDRFMSDEWREDVYGPGWRNRGGIKQGAEARFDEGYLDRHPEVAQQLGRNPGLVDNPQFLSTHPGLDTYLAAHPTVRTELQAHPRRFMTGEWKREGREPQEPRWRHGRREPQEPR